MFAESTMISLSLCLMVLSSLLHDQNVSKAGERIFLEKSVYTFLF